MSDPQTSEGRGDVPVGGTASASATASATGMRDAFEGQDAKALASEFEHFRTTFPNTLKQMQRAVVGHDELIRDVLIGVFSGGHVLLEGVPGLGKTFLVRMLGRVLELGFGRIQCTPDLMPADILGNHIVSEDDRGHRSFRFEKGPVFTHLLLVDEINRATPKTQAALLEVMQERRVTVGGDQFDLPAPFFLLATQNPLEMEGTYPLPEAQLDRFFFKLRVRYPSKEQLVEISRRTTGFVEPDVDTVMTGDDLTRFQQLITHVPVADPIATYAASLVLSTHPDGDGNEQVKRMVAYGASPRGMQTLIRAARVYCLLDGRTAVSIDDVRRAAKPALRHRIILNFEGEAESLNVDDLIDTLIRETPAPSHAAE